MNFNIMASIRFHKKSVGFIVLVFFVCCNSLTHGQASKVGIALTQFENETQGTDNEFTTPTTVSVVLEDSTTEDTQTSLESSTVETEPDDKNTNSMNVSVAWESSTPADSNTSRDSTTVDDETDTNNEVTTPINVSVETENSTIDGSHISPESSTVAIDVATVTDSTFEQSTTKSTTISLSSEIQPTNEVTSTMNVSMETEYATTSDWETSYGSQSEGTEIVLTTIADSNNNSSSVSTISPPTTTTELMITANSSRCPLVILSPGFVSTDFGTSAQFRAIVESYHDPTLESRWLRLRSSITETIDINHPKYLGSKNLPSPELLINNVTFEDEINYQLQVRIVGGWCFGNTVSLDVRGILQFYDPCNDTKECDQRKDLVCSSVHKNCMCNSNYYHRNRTCYHRSNLRAVYSNSQITTSNITVWWNHPYQDADLVQSYNVSLRERYYSYNHKAFVELQTNYTFESSFTPSFMYLLEITSNVLLSDPEETFTVRSNSFYLVVDPQPPGPINTTASNLHPQMLHLRWTASENSSYVNMYQITIDWYTQLSSSISSSWGRELEPGRNYTVQIVAICWYYHSFRKLSPIYSGVIQTLRVPKVTLPRSSYTLPFQSNFEMVASVLNVSDFPPTTSTKWQRYSQDINITDTRYNGSTEDLVYPTLVINRVDFDNDHRTQYRCVATNSEGSWTSSSTRLYLEGSLNFQEMCTRSEECISTKPLTCRQSKCLCYSWYYHKNRTCYRDYLLRVNMLEIENDTCEAVLRWSHPSVDFDLITDYNVRRQTLRNNNWVVEEMVSVGVVTQYRTKCTLQPGRLYIFSVVTIASLTDPVDTFEVYSTSQTIIMEPLSPGNLDRKMSNFSANHLFLKWNPPGGNTTLNHYRVVINGYQQQTFGSVPEIYWNKKLTPGTIYNVTIVAVSYGDLFSGPWYGSAESKPVVDWIETDTGNEEGYSYLPFGERDEVLRGDDVTSAVLKSPTTVYAGDSSQGGFTFAQIGSNGVIGLGEEFNSITIHDIGTDTLKSRRIICPFWVDLLTVDSIGNTYYQTYQRGIDAENDLFLRKANTIVRLQFADFPEFEASWIVKVTWENMTVFGDKSKTVTFQCLLITDGQSTFTVFNYIDVDLNPIKDKKIAIGYQYGSNFERNSLSNKDMAFRMSEIPGNRGVKGFWIYKMTTGVPLNKDEKECFDWYIKNKEQNTHNKLTPVLSQIRCPCNNILLRFDPRYAISRFDRINRVLCYASMIVGRNAECCYRMHGSINNLGALERSLPSAGTLLKYNPFFEQRKHSTEDFKPKEACCIKTKHCKWFYEVRPIPWCYLRSPFNPAINFGDPHIVTLDGLNYTFNGYGEYTMLNISKKPIQFDFQARTDLATTANGTAINATIFSAFVAQDQTGSKLQIEISRDKTRMLVRVNERDLTREFENTSFVYLTQNLSVRWENKTLSASFLQTSIIVKVSLGVRFLISEVVVDSEYGGHAKGLMGNFDGNPTNDFILPNGTILNKNSTKTERDVYNNFGQQWIVNEKSLFHYDKDLTYHNYTHLDFEPIFLDEIDQNKLEDAKTKCGPNPSQACIFDYLATGDIALAESSGTEEASAQSDKQIVENETPSIAGNTSINVEVGKPVYMQFKASDDSDKKPLFKILKRPPGFTLNETIGMATWIPNNTDVSEISISVIDDIGAESPSLDVSIVLCGGCNDLGRCDYNNIIPSENARYNLAACVCNVGYSGENCELDTDACLNEPCPLLRNCTDLTPEEEVRFGRGFNCTDCPLGYKDIENKCEDINECENNNAVSCNSQSETCENTDGSYLCICLPGFRKEGSTCKDIDECMEKTSGCKQICNNTHGSFKCQCFKGFSLNSDNTTCSRTDENTCQGDLKTCNYTCDMVNKKCLCPIGYQLENEEDCIDINECDAKPCQQNCTNTDGSFQCYCSAGYQLNEDKISCTECEEPNFGENCSQVCTCGQGMDRCDTVTGCVCKLGWTGVNCTDDIDECDNKTICGNEKVCHNLEGSYQCNCKDGFSMESDVCKDINECNDVSLNECSDDTVCQNLHGNYTCNCMFGFKRNGSNCEDVNECESGTADCEHICINTIGGYNCDCEFGFALHDKDRRTCQKVSNVCDNFPKLNCSYGCRYEKYGNSYEGYCFCESGFRLDIDNSTCKDIDECIESNRCQQNCTNFDGSFKCACTTGYTLENDGISCKECVSGLYGENCQTQCKCGQGSERCDHKSGCVCKSGWTGTFCDKDINECNNTENPCNNTFQECKNSVGSYQCRCKEGFNQTENDSCIDIDECEEDSICDHNCDNTNGSYQCSCLDGYTLVNNKSCEDIDECNATNLVDGCQNCTNTPGSFNCSCFDGYVLNSTTLFHCHNINECREETANCSQNATCKDTDGAYTCTCNRGFHGDGKICTRCEQFSFGNNCSSSCTCSPNNTLDCHHVTGDCECNEGWKGNDCSEDVDECSSGLHSCNETIHQVCENTAGAAHCECQYGGLDLNDCIAPIPPQNTDMGEFKVKIEIHFYFDYDREEVLNKSKEWRNEIQSKLEIFYEKHIKDITRVVVLSLRFGSIIVDHEIFANGSQQSLKLNVTNSMFKILQQREIITLFNHSTKVKNVGVYENGSKTNLNSSTNPCDVYSGMCNEDEKCDDSSGDAVCMTIKLETTDWSTLLIILGVTIPLAMTTGALAIIYVCHKRKSAQKKDSAIIRDNDYSYLSHNKDSVQDQYCTIDQYGDIYRKNPPRGYDNSDYWNSINDLLNRQEQFRIKRPTTRIN